MMRRAAASCAHESSGTAAAAVATTKPESSWRRVSTRGLYMREVSTFARVEPVHGASSRDVRTDVDRIRAKAHFEPEEAPAVEPGRAAAAAPAAVKPWARGAAYAIPVASATETGESNLGQASRIVCGENGNGEFLRISPEAQEGPARIHPH